MRKKLHLQKQFKFSINTSFHLCKCKFKSIKLKVNIKFLTDEKNRIQIQCLQINKTKTWKYTFPI